MTTQLELTQGKYYIGQEVTVDKKIGTITAVVELEETKYCVTFKTDKQLWVNEGILNRG